MATTAAQVKELRERTGLGMLDCKKALDVTAGDMDLAIDNLRKSSALKAAKKAGRTAAEGLLGIRRSEDGKCVALAEVNVETDFATKNEKFIAFVARVTDQVFAQGSGEIAPVAAALESEREALVQEIGENITIRRAAYIRSEAGRVFHYLHSDQRKAALVELSGDHPTLGLDLAMHVTAINPLVVTQADVPAKLVDKEREIAASQAADSGKPEAIIAKMVEGKVRKYLSEISLLDQPFVKDSKIKVAQLVESSNTEILQFVRFEVGEGIAVEQVDFAAEVAAQARGPDSDDTDDKG
jgi:elongation factor Ts